jgi:hypothetical protein
MSLSTLTYKHSRIEFTEDDDEHLCQYIAELLPESDEGGHAGHFIYLDLCVVSVLFILISHMSQFTFSGG